MESANAHNRREVIERATRALDEVARLSLRLKEIASDENRTSVLAKHKGDTGMMYADLYGSAQVIAELMALAAERAVSYLQEVK